MNYHQYNQFYYTRTNLYNLPYRLKSNEDLYSHSWIYCQTIGVVYSLFDKFRVRGVKEDVLKDKGFLLPYTRYSPWVQTGYQITVNGYQQTGVIADHDLFRSIRVASNIRPT